MRAAAVRHAKRSIAAIPVLQKSGEIIVSDIDGTIGSRGLRNNVARCGHRAEVGNLLAIERLATAHHLEAVVIWRIVAPSDHDRAVGRQRGGREIEHGRWSAADTHHLDAAGLQTVDQRCFQFRTR